MSCNTENEKIDGKNVLETNPGAVAPLNSPTLPTTEQLIDVAKAFVANHHESSEVINKFINECAIKNGVLPADCHIDEDSERCPSPNVDVHYQSPGADFTLQVAVQPSSLFGVAQDAFQDNQSQGGPSQ